ncbi:MAG: DCC1-like thiol-disulfide oxidoreductase family protein [Saprospiraceae bacterium]
MWPDFIPTNKMLLLYDGNCPLCIRSVRFLMARDHKDKLRFASLQEERLRPFLESENLHTMDTLVGLHQGKIYVYSRAVAMALIEIGGIWKMMGRMVLFLPTGLADWGYRMIARNRLRIFRKNAYCQIPDKSNENKFIRFS